MKKKIETKNYIILGVIIIITIFVVFYARSWYIETKEYTENNSIMSTVVSQINEAEISNYILENPNIMIYTSKTSSTEIKKSEQSLKNIIQKYNLQSQIIYLNLDETTDNFIDTMQSLSKNDNIKSKITNSEPTIYIFENGKIAHEIVGIENLTPSQIEKLLKKYGVIENE